MRILHVLGDSAFGGGSRMVIRLCESAREAGHEPAVLTTDPTFLEQLRDRSIAAVPLSCICRPIHPWHDFIGERTLYQYLRDSHYDLVHTHTSKAGFLGRRAAWRAGISAVVHTVHGFAFHEASSPSVIRTYAWLERFATRWCHQLVTVSRFHRDWAVELGIATPDRILAIPNGVTAAPRVSPERLVSLRAEFGAAPDEVLLVSPGRLAPGKGLEELLNSLAGLDSDNWRLVLPGAGPLADDLADQCRRHGLGNRVTLPGFRNDVREILAAANMAVLPTHREGLSIALLEAMAAGLPVVTTTIGSNREVTHDGDGAVLVPPGEVALLQRELASLLADGDRRRDLGARALSIYESEFTEPRMLAAYLDLYASLMPGS